MKKYICKNCKEEWEFYPEDYKYKKSDYPTTCPLCQMSISQCFRDIKKIEGLFEAIKFVFINRIWKKNRAL